ncbi:MAG: thiamine-phosphate kinase [Deltaproteobacteria bacterium]|nr:MAG: thiamine-phosphate kinase [Deltaproteobacteria bacterium]
MRMTMTLKRIGEFGLIERISSGCLFRPERVIRGIGDDAAAVTTTADETLLLSTDMLVEGIHFLRRAVSGEDLGCKALAVNLSDIAAMGGMAREALVSIAVPEDCGAGFIEAMYRGMKSLAARYHVNIIGGDTTGSRSDLVISITVTGSVAKNRILRRDQARVGDVVCLTGYPGESAAGLYLILNPVDGAADFFDHLLRRHHRPRPHLKEGQWLAGSGAVHAAIDISDGLSSDLGHVIRQSGVGVRIDAGCLPVSTFLQTFCDRFECDPIDYILDGGEDYVLLCTVSPDAVSGVSTGFEATFGRPLHQIGEIVAGSRFKLTAEAGDTRIVSPKGWNHFKKELNDGE